MRDLRSHRLLPLLSSLALLAGCAATPNNGPAAWRPTIDTKTAPAGAYENDLAECQTYANANPQTDGNKQAVKTGKKWGLGMAAATGALMVATGGLGVVGLPLIAGAAAAQGAVMGTTTGIAAKVGADVKYRQIVRTCLAGRGHTVLD